MNTPRDEIESDEVGAAYRDLARESTPPSLTDAVLRQAAQATVQKPGRFWMRPLAWAAVLGLSLAIVLDVARTPEVATVPASVDEAFRPSDMNILEEVEDQARTRAGNSPPPAAELRLDSNTLQDAPAARESAAAQSAAEPAAIRLEKAFTAEQPSCSAEVRGDAGNWQDCILALLEAGQARAAEQELDALREAFPDFVPQDDRLKN